MPSVGTLNALLNAALLAAVAAADAASRRAYVLASSRALASRGVTGATDTAEVHASHWLGIAARRVWGGVTGGGLWRTRGARAVTPLPSPQGGAGGGAAGETPTDSWAGGDGGGPAADEAADGGCSLSPPLPPPPIPWWSFCLAALLLALLPAELYAETGLHESPTGATEAMRRTNGVCASPWAGHSDVGVAASALLVQRLGWQDPVWSVVGQGASKAMDVAELFATAPGDNGGADGSGGDPIVVADCTAVVSPCPPPDGCGALTVHRTGGPFDTVVTAATAAPAAVNASLAAPPGTYGRGDVTYDGAAGVAFFWWELPAPPAGGEVIPPQHRRRGGTAVAVRGIEVLLSPPQVGRVLQRGLDPWILPVPAGNHTRAYTLTCGTDGLRSRDVAMGVSLYRTMMMEQPGVRRTGLGAPTASITALPPLGPSDVAKAAYALKADDASSTCEGMVRVYRPRGAYHPASAVPFGVAVAAVVGVWAALAAAGRGGGRVCPPHNGESWRAYAAAADARAEAAEAAAGASGAAGAARAMAVAAGPPRWDAQDDSIGAGASLGSALPRGPPARAWPRLSPLPPPGPGPPPRSEDPTVAGTDWGGDGGGAGTPLGEDAGAGEGGTPFGGGRISTGSGGRPRLSPRGTLRVALAPPGKAPPGAVYLLRQ